MHMLHGIADLAPGFGEAGAVLAAAEDAARDARAQAVGVAHFNRPILLA